MGQACSCHAVPSLPPSSFDIQHVLAITVVAPRQPLPELVWIKMLSSQAPIMVLNDLFDCTDGIVRPSMELMECWSLVNHVKVMPQHHADIAHALTMVLRDSTFGVLSTAPPPSLKTWKSTLPLVEEYAVSHAAYHWIHAEQYEQAASWFFDFNKLLWRVTVQSTEAISQDVMLLKRSSWNVQETNSSLEWIDRFLVLATSPLKRDPRELASQILGRLRPTDSSALLENLRQSTWQWVTATTTDNTELLIPSFPMFSGMEPPSQCRTVLMAGMDVICCAASPFSDVHCLISAQGDGAGLVQHWNWAWRIEEETLNDVTLQAIVYGSHTSEFFACTTHECVWIDFNKENGHVVFLDSNEEDGNTINAIAFAMAPNGNKRGLSACGHVVQIWDLDKCVMMKELNGHTDLVKSVAISADASLALSGSWDECVGVWQLTANDEWVLLRMVHFPSAVSSVGLFVRQSGNNGDGGSDVVACCGAYDTLYVWDPMTGGQGKKLHGHVSTITSLIMSQDGTRCLTGSKDRTVRLWDLVQGRLIKVMHGHSCQVTSVSLSRDGKTAFSCGGMDGTRVWNLESVVLDDLTQAAPGDEVFAMCVLRKEASSSCPPELPCLLLSAGRDCTLRVWNVVTGEVIKKLEGHYGHVLCLTVSSNETMILTGSRDRSARVWNLKTGKNVLKLEGHYAAVQSVAFSHCGTRALTGGDDRMVRLWNLENGVPVNLLLKEPTGAPDDHVLRCKTIWKLVGHKGMVGAVTFWGNDTSRGLSASEDKTIRVWDFTRGTCWRVFEGKCGIRKLVVMDNKLLWCKDGDGKVMVWNFEHGTVARGTREKYLWDGFETKMIGARSDEKVGLVEWPFWDRDDGVGCTLDLEWLVPSGADKRTCTRGEVCGNVVWGWAGSRMWVWEKKQCCYIPS